MKRGILYLLTIVFSLYLFSSLSAYSDDIIIPLNKRPVAPEVLTRFDACIPLPDTSIDKMPDYNFPKPVSSNPPVYYLDLGDKKHVFMKDIDKPETKVYNRLYYDSDHDKDLSDEEPIHLNLKVVGRGYYQQFSIVELDLDLFGQKMWKFRTTEGGFALDSKEYAGRNTTSMNLQFRDSLSGDFTLDGDDYRIDFFDVLTDGKISSAVSTNRYRKDIMGITKKTDAPEKEIRVPFETLPNILVIGNHSLYVNPDIDGKSCVLSEIPKKGSGTVKFDDDTLYTMLTSKNHSVLLWQPKGKIRLPPGKYKSFHIFLMRRSKKGIPWIIKKVRCENDDITIATGTLSTIDITEPFIMSCEMRKSSREENNNYPCIKFSDKNGKAMSSDIYRPRWPMAPCPTYKLINTAGEEVKLGKMSYGWNNYVVCWQGLPAGKYKLILNFEDSPFAFENTEFDIDVEAAAKPVKE